MKDLSKFVSAFKEGFQRPSRFSCQIFLPLTMLANIILQSSIDGVIDFLIPTGQKDAKGLLSAPIVAEWLMRGLLVEEARLPSRAFEMTEFPGYGITERVPYHTEYTSFPCTFLMPYVGNDNGVPKFFDYWMNFIQNNQRGPESGLDFRFPSEYYGKMLLHLHDMKDQPTITYEFEKVYPTTVDSVAVSWNAGNQFAKLPVTFTYSYWKIVPSVPLPIF